MTTEDLAHPEDSWATQPVRVADSYLLLQALFECNGVGIRHGAIFERTPSAGQRPWSRVEGMMLGLAIGDALGNVTERLLPRDRHVRFGEIRDYLPNRHAAGAARGVPSDDSQLAFRTLQQLTDDGGYCPERVAARLCDGELFGIGHTFKCFRHNLIDLREPWHMAGPESADSSALMRIAPILIPHLRNPSPALWADTALAAMTTNNDEASTGTCVAFMSLLWELLAMTRPPDAAWWGEAFVRELRGLENGRAYDISRGRFAGWRGPLSNFVEARLREATRRDLSARQACDEWGSGESLFETVPSALYILARWAHDPQEALIRAVNDTVDNDTIAAIVGAALGALHGTTAWPARWRLGLLGRIEAEDGRLFDVLDMGKRMFAQDGGQQPPEVAGERERVSEIVVITRQRFRQPDDDAGERHDDCRRTS
jgi:ADP-ribosyl-[dinitrogen reductase] hydrolase